MLENLVRTPFLEIILFRRKSCTLFQGVIYLSV